MMAPVLEQAGGFRGYSPLAGVRPLAPVVDLVADAVDDLGVPLVLLLPGGQAPALVEYERFLPG